MKKARHKFHLYEMSRTRGGKDGEWIRCLQMVTAGNGNCLVTGSELLAVNRIILNSIVMVNI
jgi:hypothetical protein